MAADGRTTPGPSPSLTPPPVPAPARRGAARAARPSAKGPSPSWGWLELFVLSQTLLPALLFLPGISPVRTPIRIAAYAIGLVAWAFLAWRGTRGPGDDTFPARTWLIVAAAWLGLSIVHPNSYSIVAATAQVALYVSVFSPAFWAPSALTSTRQIGRLMALLFLCNALSSLVGIGQVFRPEIFNPPVIPAMNNVFQGEDMMYEAGDGHRILRPCGLTDSPGAVAPAGMAAALLGLCWALLPIALWKRVASLGLALAGMAAIYYTQVRLTIVMLGICLVTLTAILAIQRNFRQVGLLAVLGAVVVLGASAWVVRSSGSAVIERLSTLFTSDPGKLYQQSRGGFVQHAFGEVLWEHPLGYGLGWWGMINVSFGDPQRPSPVWVEVMWPAWIYDGGFPLLIAYVGALITALYDSTRIALTSKDRELAFWAAVVVALNLSIVAQCFSFVAFLAPIGLQFWLLSAALHAADARTRRAGAAVKKPLS